MKSRFTLIIILALLQSLCFAATKSKITNIKLVKHSNGFEKLVVEYSGKLLGEPELKVGKNFLQILIPNSYVWPKLKKSVKTPINGIDTTLLAYQYDSGNVRARAVINNLNQGVANKAYISLKNHAIELIYPVATSSISKKLTKKGKAKAKSKAKNSYDEAYLDQLLGLKGEGTGEKKQKAKIARDEIKTSLASLESKLKSDGKSQIDWATYLGKFVGFLALVILFFYGIVTLLKKGVIKKGKLGFLNDTKVVQVVNTTYLSPKRSLIMVKVHGQVFLLSNTENGISFLSEIHDVPKMIKDGERRISGSNFDTNLTSADELKNLEEKVKMKDLDKIDLSEQAAKVSFSEQMKKKFKDLKPLQ
ncbi:MAG: FliO/MopB family protein [Bacteriovoracaceae bacterium]|jgi:flagellar biogenesis protein FliO|nr:FliO/MopB family protein [Bacteriovoracaceae bacterium]